VWLYLSSVDFTAWNRVDLMSPDFQYQIERLFIQFVQRNRSFFGEQGRKRMSDVRMLISACAATVVEDLRNHLTGQNKNRPPFGSPRPVPSWATTNATGHAEPGWEQIAQSTFLLQQQLQEWRGEIRGVPQLPTPAQSETRQSTPAAAQAAKRPANGAGMAKVTNDSQQDNSGLVVKAVSVPEGTRNGIGNGNATSAPAARASGPLHSSAPSARTGEPLQPPTPPVAPVAPASRGPAANGKGETLTPPVQPAPAAPAVPIVPVEAPAIQTPASARQVSQVAPQDQVKSSAPVPSQAATPKPTQARSVPQPATPASVAATQRESSTPVLSGEDVAIFEQLRHQLLVWLRVEAVQCGLDISGQSPGQLLDLLRQQGGIDETRLQVVSSLLSLANQVIKNGQAGLLDYKQAMMFHLMHTRSRRSS
jgi:hypothetical protein